MRELELLGRYAPAIFGRSPSLDSASGGRPWEGRPLLDDRTPEIRQALAGLRRIEELSVLNKKYALVLWWVYVVHGSESRSLPGVLAEMAISFREKKKGEQKVDLKNPVKMAVWTEKGFRLWQAARREYQDLVASKRVAAFTPDDPGDGIFF